MKTLAALFGLVALWLVGLVVFAGHVKGLTPATEPTRADAVVALTGASDARIVEAVRLLQAGKAKRLLVSGVNKKVTRGDIQALTGAPDTIYNCCVDLGFEAKTTLGNAQETAAWVKAKSFDSLIVVTSDYHMPRSMLELRSALPGVKLTPYPVATPSVNVGTWWRSPKSARLLAWEYTKFLVVGARELVLGLGRHAPEPKGVAGAPSAA